MLAVKEYETIAALREALSESSTSGGVVGLVPTMGALHEGHASNVAHAAAECDVVLVTIFVNPLQFAEGEDFEDYPRDLDTDRKVVEAAGGTHLFAPPPAEMYPARVRTEVRVPSLSQTLEGASRPEHFSGVATVVTKLFAIVGACRAYFGEKDFQQLAIVRRLAADLSLPVDVIGCPTVREVDGLAMSSRNVYLRPEERGAALVLYRALQSGVASILGGERDAGVVRTLMADIVRAEPLAELDYAEAADPETLEPLGRLDAGQSVRLLGAARVGRPRLLDNLGVVVPA